MGEGGVRSGADSESGRRGLCCQPMRSRVRPVGMSDRVGEMDELPDEADDDAATRCK